MGGRDHRSQLSAAPSNGRHQGRRQPLARAALHTCLPHTEGRPEGPAPVPLEPQPFPICRGLGYTSHSWAVWSPRHSKTSTEA